MKATLEYDLPDEDQEFQDAMNGMKWKAVMWDLDQRLRAIEKHSPDSMNEEAYQAYCHARQLIREYMTDYGINFDV